MLTRVCENASEEPKPEIAENPLANGHSYDLWWANLSAFAPDYATSGAFYVYLTAQPAGEIQVWQYQRSAANPSLRVDDNQAGQSAPA